MSGALASWHGRPGNLADGTVEHFGFVRGWWCQSYAHTASSIYTVYIHIYIYIHGTDVCMLVKLSVGSSFQSQVSSKARAAKPSAQEDPKIWGPSVPLPACIGRANQTESGDRFDWQDRRLRRKLSVVGAGLFGWPLRSMHVLFEFHAMPEKAS